MRARLRRDLALTFCLFLVSMATVWAEADLPAEESPVTAAVVTDQPARDVSSEDVAREVLRLQEEMGGSIISDLDTAPGWEDSPKPSLRRTGWNQAPQVPPRRSGFRDPSSTAVNILRETARQLEQSAHQLESLDQYPQADSLREMADKLRHDARKMRASALNESLREAVE